MINRCMVLFRYIFVVVLFEPFKTHRVIYVENYISVGFKSKSDSPLIYCIYEL